MEQQPTTLTNLDRDFANELETRQKKTLIIIPAFNEAENIPNLVKELSKINYPLDFLIINDGSRDNTVKLCRDLKINYVSHPFNLGIGGAVQTGFRYAAENEYDFAIQLDGDGQHDPNYLETIIRPVLNDEVDMCIGSRFLPPYDGFQSSFIRRIGINFFSLLISTITGIKITDPTSGFRCFNQSLIQIFAKYYPHDFPEPEAIVVAKRYGARIKEVPVSMRKRVAGASSIRYFKTGYYMIKVTVAILLDQLKQKKA